MSDFLEDLSTKSKSSMDVSNIWPKINEELLLSRGQDTYRSWFSKLRFYSMDKSSVVLSAPTAFVKEWIVNNYSGIVKKICIEAFAEHDISISYVSIIASSVNENNDGKSDNINANLSNDFTKERDSSVKLSAPLDKRFTFDNFIIGKSNELGFAAARRIAESDGPVPGSNPLFLYGGVGLGKTHLMHSIAWHIRQSRPQRIVVYISAEKFMYMFVNALRSKDIMSFKHQFRSVDVLLIDDMQFMIGKESTQEEFFHTFNSLVDQGKQLIVSADRSPSDLEMEERIKSRLGWGLVADIDNTTFELRMGILQSLAQRMSCDIPKDVIEFLARQISSNIRELEGALNKILAHSSFTNSPIHLSSAKDILSDLLRANQRELGVEDIKKRVAEYFKIKISDIQSSSRSRMVARPRQIGMYMSKFLTTCSLPAIGRAFGGKDHTTVMHAIKRIEELIETDSEVRDAVAYLKNACK